MSDDSIDQAVRQQVLYLLNGGGAHLDFDSAVADMPEEMRGAQAGR